jgi:predicted phosphoribosyltransferase
MVSATAGGVIMITEFRDRVEAGQLLAEKLAAYANQPDVLVLGLPRGGVPVAAQVARRLHAPLDVFVVRKLGLPGDEELAMGAIATGGVRVLNREVVGQLRIPDEVIDAVAADEQRELVRRERAYRDDLPAPDVAGKTVILVDDGIATGSTMFAAIEALRKLNAGRIVVAVPTVSPATFYEMERVVDEIVAVMMPEHFRGVGQWYQDFSQTSDEEVRQLLGQADTRFRGLHR